MALSEAAPAAILSAMLKLLAVAVLAVSFASCGGQVEAAVQTQDPAAAKAEGGCCGGCSAEPAAEACCDEGEAKGAAKQGDACCSEGGAAKLGGGCCSEGLVVPPAEAKKSGS
jgi:hypothetical protein